MDVHVRDAGGEAVGDLAFEVEAGLLYAGGLEVGSEGGEVGAEAGGDAGRRRAEGGVERAACERIG
jgi:hypothetical protein